MNILMAEDDPVSGIVLKKYLAKAGHEIVQASDGREAWGLYQKRHFQCVISDWMMPEMDGIELCRRIRNEDRTRYTYFILLTARSGKENYLEAMNAGADDFLIKPVDEDQLVTRLRVAERVLKLQEHVKQLEGLLSICSYCKQIEENGSWTRIEEYVGSHTDAQFSHGICPKCYETFLKTEIDGLK